MIRSTDAVGKILRVIWTYAARIPLLLIPRRKDLWVFGSWYGGRYADNSRALYEYTVSQGHVNAVWLSKQTQIVQELVEAGYPAALTRSMLGVWTCARAGVFIYDCGTSDINAALSWHAIRINLWHGVPLKKLGPDIVVDDHPSRTLYSSPIKRWGRLLTAPAHLDRPDFMITTSNAMCARYESAFDLAASQLRALGQPRTDENRIGSFMLAAERRSLSILQEARRASQGAILYAPTFREARPLDIAEIVFSLSKACASVGWRLFVKLHAGDVANVTAGTSDFDLIPSDIDLNRILGNFDALVTDYSSIFIDFLLLDRPIVFYAPDIIHYEAGERGFYDDYRESAPGPIAETLTELASEVQNLARGEDDAGWSAKRARQRDWYHTFAGESCKRVNDFIMQVASSEGVKNLNRVGHVENS